MRFQLLVRDLAIGCLLVIGTQAMAENTINIGGSGSNSVNVNVKGTNGVIDLYQVSSGALGERNEAGTGEQPITQTGSGHVARIGQGATYSGGVWVPGDPVSGNTAIIKQTGASGDSATILQTSSNNTAVINQGGAAATAVINQGGLGGNSASIETTSTYVGAGVIVTQTGADNIANVTGMSGGSANINQSGTGGTVNLANQTSGALNISQEGTNNALSITNYGAGASAGMPLTITQTGVGGATSTTFNPSAPTGPIYSPAPP
jgi:hypothetical protein